MPTPPPLSTQLAHCADALQAVRSGHPPGMVLTRLDSHTRPGVQALTFHVLRQLGAATEVRRLLVPKTPPPRVDALLCCALAILWPAGEPLFAAHTLVDQAVVAVRRRDGSAAGLVNAVLRRFLRERDALVAQALREPTARFNHPAWWIEQLRRDWPAAWEPLLQVANQRPPMTLRVNARRSNGAAYVQRLAALGRGALLLDGAVFGGQAVVLTQPCPVGELPGFAEGEVSVQDAAAQRTAGLLATGGLRAGAHVLDACAAPGGKAAQLLERFDVELLALDRDAERLQRVDQTFVRLGLAARTQAADAARPQDWWDGRLFDAIVLDAPCSASGIVRRHPDIRWLRREPDLASLAAQQSSLLDALWPLVAPGGMLLYATCSLFVAEGRQQIDAFLQRPAAVGARLHPASPGHLLPVPDNEQRAGRGEVLHDGFYYALMHKAPD